MNEALLEVVTKKKRIKKTVAQEGQAYASLAGKKLKDLKTAYKRGKLKFNSEKIADAILREFKRGFTK